MSREIIIFSIFAILSGCAVSKRPVTKIETPVSTGLSMPERILSMNMTNNNFDIEKSEIEITGNGESQKLLAFVKYRIPGIYLLSIKHKSGIEAARIYVTKDTVLINDRINRKLYYGSTEYLLNKYGITTNALPLLLGDFLYSKEYAGNLENCKDGKSEIEGSLEEKNIWYSIDCNKAKVSAVKIGDELEITGVSINFQNFKSIGKVIFPGLIQVEDFTGQTKIEIKITSVDFNNNEKIEFIPGKNFKKIHLK